MQIRSYRYRLLGFSLLALSLAGCTPSQPVKVSAGSQPQSTAPPLPLTPQTQQAASPPQPTQPSGRQQHVRQLIQQVEQAYAQGQAAYKKGDLVTAKVDFDHAVDLMLTSGLDIKADSQLQDEFDRIVDGVNSLEMESLKQGNGFVPKEEPTPADVASDVTFEVDPNIVAKAKADLATTKSDLPLVVNDYVAAYINFFANTQRGHNTLLHSFQRAGRYKAMIQRVMAEEGVPQDLIYLAVAESGFNPRAVNARSRAGGMWQFMPNDKFYGLARNEYVDERFDPEKSTRAYARYMKFIYDQLGDWYLAMAAYDHGTGNIQHAVQRTGYADFWELYKRNNLPGETKNYVPEILAAIIIANNPSQYGFDDVTLDPPLLTDTVTINYSVDLRLVSDIVDAPVDELTALNPSMLRMVTPPDASFDLHLPAGTATLYEQRIASVPEAKRTAWRYHHVAGDDTLASVAHEFHVSESELADANQLQSTDSLQGVEALVVPTAPPAASTRMLLYIARRGDTLVTIADRFGVSLTQLRRWNRMSGVKVEPGRRLHVAEPVGALRSSSRSHRRTTPAAAGKALQAASTKGSTHKATTPSSHKKSARAASAATKNAPPSAKKKHSSKTSAHKKSSSQ
ncbi:MAG TPA: transglycosylase SLT domain-containing protein [Terracidiphilus sp.]